MDGVAYLRMPVYIQDELGQDVLQEIKETQILVTEKSITRAEFFEAGRSGMNPQTVLETAAVNYSGEPECKYNGVIYSIYRTYYSEYRSFNSAKGTNYDSIELYLEKKAGVYE